MHNTPDYSGKRPEDKRHQGMVKFGRCFALKPGQFCTLINSQLFGAARIDQLNLAIWFENLHHLSDDSDETFAIMYLADLYNLEDAIDRHDEVIIWHGTSEDYAAEIIDETMDIESFPEIIRYHIDYAGIARDLELNSEITEIDRDIWVVNCFDF